MAAAMADLLATPLLATVCFVVGALARIPPRWPSAIARAMARSTCSSIKAGNSPLPSASSAASSAPAETVPSHADAAVVHGTPLHECWFLSSGFESAGPAQPLEEEQWLPCPVTPPPRTDVRSTELDHISLTEPGGRASDDDDDGVWAETRPRCDSAPGGSFDLETAWRDHRGELDDDAAVLAANQAPLSPAAAVQHARALGAARAKELQPGIERLQEVVRAQGLRPIGALLAARYLVANKGIPERAAKQYAAALAWRASEGLDTIELDAPLPPKVAQVLERGYSPYIVDGLDLHARPVMIIPLGQLDLPGMHKRGATLQMVLRRHLGALEQLQRHVHAAPNPYAGALVMLDLGGCTVAQFLRAYPFWRAATHLGQNYYPELPSTIVIMRGPAAAVWGTEQVKRFLEPEVRDKIRISGGSALPALRAHLPLTTPLPADSPLGPWPPREAAD